MKKCSRLILFASITTLLAGCATVQYVGDTYPPTNHVDLYFKEADIKRPYKMIGKGGIASEEGLSMNAQKMQQKLVATAKQKGADALLLSETDRVSIGTSRGSNISVYELRLGAQFLRYTDRDQSGGSPEDTAAPLR